MRRIFHGNSLTGAVTRPTFATECVGVLTNGKVAGVTLSGVPFVPIKSVVTTKSNFPFRVNNILFRFHDES